MKSTLERLGVKMPTSQQLETLAVLALGGGMTLSTTQVLDAGWVGRSALLRRLNKLAELGLATRERMRGVRGYVWTIKAKGLVVASAAAKAGKKAA